MQDFLSQITAVVIHATTQFFERAVAAYERFLENLSLELALQLVVAYAFVIWAAFVIWVIKDITNRSSSLFLQTLSVLLVIGLTPLFGVPIYLLIRPSTTLLERYYAEVASMDEPIVEDVVPTSLMQCPECSAPIREEYRYCPACGASLTLTCAGCGKEVEKSWNICPYCGKQQWQEEVTSKLSSSAQSVSEQSGDENPAHETKKTPNETQNPNEDTKSHNDHEKYKPPEDTPPASTM